MTNNGMWTCLHVVNIKSVFGMSLISHCQGSWTQHFEEIRIVIYFYFGYEIISLLFEDIYYLLLSWSQVLPSSPSNT